MDLGAGRLAQHSCTWLIEIHVYFVDCVTDSAITDARAAGFFKYIVHLVYFVAVVDCSTPSKQFCGILFLLYYSGEKRNSVRMLAVARVSLLAYPPPTYNPGDSAPRS